MLVLGRKEDQSILIDGNVRVTVMKIKGKTVRLGIEASPEIAIIRAELRSWSDSPLIEQSTRSPAGDSQSECVENGSLI